MPVDTALSGTVGRTQRPDGYFNVWVVHIDPARGEQIGKAFQVTYLGSPRWPVACHGPR